MKTRRDHLWGAGLAIAATLWSGRTHAQAAGGTTVAVATTTTTATANTANTAAPGPTVAPAQPAVVDPRERYTGTFTFVGGDSERRGIESAIERSVTVMNFIVRGIARGRLRETNQAYASVTIRFPPGSIEVFRSGDRAVRSRDDGTQGSALDIHGDPLRVTQRFENGRLVQHIWNDDGGGRHEYSLSADGRTLIHTVHITSRHLPVPVHYSLTFRRG
jgi:hypothetical protein